MSQTARHAYEAFIRSNPDREGRRHDLERLGAWDALGSELDAALDAALVAARYQDQMRAFEWTHSWLIVKAYAGDELAEIAADLSRNTGQVGLAVEAALQAGTPPAPLDPTTAAGDAIAAYDAHEVGLLGHAALREGDPEPRYPRAPLYQRMHPDIDWAAHPGLGAEEDDY
jgi:hypothetical protein